MQTVSIANKHITNDENMAILCTIHINLRLNFETSNVNLFAKSVRFFLKLIGVGMATVFFTP